MSKQKILHNCYVTKLQQLLVRLGNCVRFTDRSATVTISRVKTPRKAPRTLQSFFQLKFPLYFSPALQMPNNLATGNLIHRVLSYKLRPVYRYALRYCISAEVTYFPIPVLCWRYRRLHTVFKTQGWRCRRRSVAAPSGRHGRERASELVLEQPTQY